MLITIRKNKAHQTLAVMGSVDNALKAALSELKDFSEQYAHARARGAIIAKNLTKLNIHSNNSLNFGVDVGYSFDSLKSWLYPAPVIGGFVLPLIVAIRLYMACCLSSLGVLGSGNAPAVHDSESTPTFIGGSKSQIHGGSHA